MTRARLLLSLTLVFALGSLASIGSACSGRDPSTPAEGEGGVGEGEGEGEGGEGEGEGGVGEGEGEGGEGEGGEGEGGEGEGGEGEGGEGEGAGGDEAGGPDDPTPILAFPFEVVVDIATAGDQDCYSFTVDHVVRFNATAHALDCETRQTDPRIQLYQLPEIVATFDGNDDDGLGGYCSALTHDLDPGDYVVCAAHSAADGRVAGVTLHVDLAELLGDGAPCDPANNGCAVGFVCTGATPVCTGAGAAACANVVDVNASPFAGTIGDTNFIKGSCTFIDRNETVLHFVPTQFALQNLTFTADQNVSAISVRTECVTEGSELGCDTVGTLTVPAVATGTDLFLVVENETAGAFSLTITADEVTVLAVDAVCDPVSTTNVCDPTAGLRCVDLGAGPKCQAPGTPQTLAGAIVAGDATWTRFDATCAASTTVAPFDTYRVTNAGAGAVEVTTTTHTVGDASTCPFDTMVHFVPDPFDPAAPGQCLAVDDDAGPDLCSLARFNVAAGATVDAIVSPFHSDDTGDYEITFTTAGGDVTVTVP